MRNRTFSHIFFIAKMLNQSVKIKKIYIANFNNYIIIYTGKYLRNKIIL